MIGKCRSTVSHKMTRASEEIPTPASPSMTVAEMNGFGTNGQTIFDTINSGWRTAWNRTVVAIS